MVETNSNISFLSEFFLYVRTNILSTTIVLRNSLQQIFSAIKVGRLFFIFIITFKFWLVTDGDRFELVFVQIFFNQNILFLNLCLLECFCLSCSLTHMIIFSFNFVCYIGGKCEESCK